ncbi:MAG: YcaO-like family protein [Phyllobacteriaceae bacterium]|nr:YcaO-like family protein [Phyllobacteriaceae bacterium]
MHGPPSNIDALRAFAGNLDGIQAVHPPDAPGASIVMALGRDRAGHSVTFAGCGLSLDEAFVSCVGEAAEWSAQNARQRPLAKAAPALPAIADFDQLFAESPVHAEWVALDGLGGTPDGRAPRDLFVAGAPLRLPLSHGCAAGSNPDAALFGALCEWVERDAALAWWSGQRRAQGACAAAKEAAQDWLTEARQKTPGASRSCSTSAPVRRFRSLPPPRSTATEAPPPSA